jgi:hypothetical protein
VADEGTGAPAPSGSAPDLGWHPVGASPKDPGWYPTGTNPNDQAYWDGQGWSRTRRWTVTGWVEEGMNPVAVAPAPGAGVAAPRFSANPYAPVTTVTAPPRQKVSPSLSFGTFTLLVSAVLLMVGTDMNWVTAGPIGTQGLNIADGVTGFSVVIIGIVLTALAAGQVVNDDDWGLRVLSLVTSWTALGFAIYFLVRVLQAINGTSAPKDASVGTGLIIVMIAAVVAAAISAARMRTM